MHFIFGGRHMGMLEYAEGLRQGAAVLDAQACGAEEFLHADIIVNIHMLVKSILKSGGSPLEFFQANIETLRGKIVIGDEIGCGVVPVDAFEREWRDETGRVYQLLAANAADVTRVWAGLPQALKREKS